MFKLISVSSQIIYFSTDKGGPGKDSLIFNLSPDQSVFPNSVPEEKKKVVFHFEGDP